MQHTQKVFFFCTDDMQTKKCPEMRYLQKPKHKLCFRNLCNRSSHIMCTAQSQGVYVKLNFWRNIWFLLLSNNMHNNAFCLSPELTPRKRQSHTCLQTSPQYGSQFLPLKKKSPTISHNYKIKCQKPPTPISMPPFFVFYSRYTYNYNYNYTTIKDIKHSGWLPLSHGSSTVPCTCVKCPCISKAPPSPTPSKA